MKFEDLSSWKWVLRKTVYRRLWAGLGVAPIWILTKSFPYRCTFSIAKTINSFWVGIAITAERWLRREVTVMLIVFFSFTSLHLYVFSVVSSIQMKDCVQWCSEDCCEYSKYQWILVLLINSFVKEVWKLGTCLKRLSLLLLLVFDAYKEKLKSDNVTKFLNAIYWHPSLIWDYTTYEFNSSILSFF